MQNGIKTKVKAVQGAGTWDSDKFGMLYKFEYTMDDGTVLVAMHKENKAHEVGKEVEYIITGENEHGKRGKVAKPSTQSNTQTNAGGGRKNDDYVKGIEVGHAVNCAIQIIGFRQDEDFTKENIITWANTIMEVTTELKKQ